MRARVVLEMHPYLSTYLIHTVSIVCVSSDLASVRVDVSTSTAEHTSADLLGSGIYAGFAVHFARSLADMVDGLTRKTTSQKAKL